ncbi:kinase-like protein [Pluteus cervinus]|uniref:Kinase-like protein n=1 Tax=Pluteus cervinus TaxID=181527 RepID=A0ACD3BCK6_9AGAR|nr:kinase-like protein [Pluteus cervinus]
MHRHRPYEISLRKNGTPPLVGSRKSGPKSSPSTKLGSTASGHGAVPFLCTTTPFLPVERPDRFLSPLNNTSSERSTAKSETSPRLSLPISPSIPSFNHEAFLYSRYFKSGHLLNPYFVIDYQLEDELGSGGYGFVMTARHRKKGHEVAVKFIIKDKVPESGWMEDHELGRLPTEIVLVSLISHENIVKCLDLYEDELYFYLVQELHGSPWAQKQLLVLPPLRATHTPSTPALSPSVSDVSLDSEIHTPPLSPTDETVQANHPPKFQLSAPATGYTAKRFPICRRPSHDLFECIEQSENKRLTEDQARYVFAQVVDAVCYLDGLGITHRDIKDENLVIDRNLKVKLIDFGSATIDDPTQPRPFHTLFFGTTAYASSEILRKQTYQAPPAEIWTLGVLLSFLLTGTSPFPSMKDAIEGNVRIEEGPTSMKISHDAMDLMALCLDPNPATRATISHVRLHKWLRPEFT